jgi:threonine aldolase
VNFASDNNAGVCPEVLDALGAEAERSDAAYGWDRASAELADRLATVFERPVEVYCVATGTAANALALAATNPVWGAVVCHASAHIVVDECSAPTVIGSGLVLEPIDGPHGKLGVDGLRAHLAQRRSSGVHTAALTGLSVTQATEAGTRYSAAELTELCAAAHGHGLAVHLDGARFANAVAATGASPAELSWRAGVDLMSLGATKGGALGAEAVVVFQDRLLDDIERLRKRTGHLLSKQRFVAAQFNGWLADGAWLAHADHANEMAQRLAAGLSAVGIEPIHPVEANMVFAHLSPAAHDAARAAGAQFYVESPAPAEDGSVEVRLVTSWSTQAADIDGLLDVLHPG